MTKYKIYAAKRFDTEFEIETDGGRDDAKFQALGALRFGEEFTWTRTDIWVDLVEEVIDDDDE